MSAGAVRSVFAALMDLERSAADRFVAPPSPDTPQRLYGGQLLAQSLMAAQHTVADDRAPHSLHGYFARSGDPGAPCELTVDRLRDGRSFSLREVVVTQRGRMLFRMHTSFHVAEETPRYQGAAMPRVAPPEAVNFTYDAFTLQQTGKSDWHGAARPMDIRYVNPPRAPRGEPVTEPQIMWQRIAEELPDTAGLHAAGLAYLSDSTLVDSIMLPLGMRWQDEDFAGVSLDHAMWFHQPVRADEWLLFEQRPQVTGAGRGLASGCFFSRDGRLVATCQQEGLMRWTAAPGKAAPDAGTS